MCYLNFPIIKIQYFSGQEEPSRCEIRQNWYFFRYVWFGTSQSISKTCFDLIATKNVIKCCLNFLIFIHFHVNFKILLTLFRFNCWCSCAVLPDHWRVVLAFCIAFTINMGKFFFFCCFASRWKPSLQKCRMKKLVWLWRTLKACRQKYPVFLLVRSILSVMLSLLKRW